MQGACPCWCKAQVHLRTWHKLSSCTLSCLIFATTAALVVGLPEQHHCMLCILHAEDACTSASPSSALCTHDTCHDPRFNTLAYTYWF